MLQSGIIDGQRASIGIAELIKLLSPQMAASHVISQPDSSTINGTESSDITNVNEPPLLIKMQRKELLNCKYDKSLKKLFVVQVIGCTDLNALMRVLSPYG